MGVVVAASCLPLVSRLPENKGEHQLLHKGRYLTM